MGRTPGKRDKKESDNKTGKRTRANKEKERQYNWKKIHKQPRKKKQKTNTRRPGKR